MVNRDVSTAASPDREQLFEILAPLCRELGFALVSEGSGSEGDVPIEWDHQVVAYARLLPITSALDRLARMLEREFGARLSELTRAEKEAAVRRFEEEGAFKLRHSVSDVARILAISRVTVYGYLNAIYSSGKRGSASEGTHGGSARR